MQIEKNHNKLSCTEFLLSFQHANIVAKDKMALRKNYPLEEDWEGKVRGRRVVCFAISSESLHGITQDQAMVLMGVLNYVRKTFRQAQGVLLWWLDDGLIEKMLNSVEERQGEEGKRKQAGYNYSEFLREFQKDEKAVYDDTGNVVRAVAWADAYYGDACDVAEAFRQAGKVLFWQDTNRQNISSGKHIYLHDWLDMVTQRTKSLAWKEPEGWHEAHRGRKVILYYHTAEALLSLGEEAIEQIERVTKMATARNSLCFYWLADKETLKALVILSEDLQKRYRVCWQTFEETVNCCCDRENPLSVAMQQVDIYYGDDVAWLDEFRRLGKPIVIQSYNLGWGADRILHQLQGETFGLSFVDGEWVGDYYYFPAWWGNGLFRLHKNSERAEYVSHIPARGNRSRMLLYSAMAYFNGRFFLIPALGKDIMIYSIDEGTWEYISVSCEYAWDHHGLFMSAVRQGDILWLVPLNFYAVGRFDLRTCELTYIGDWGKNVEPYILNPGSQHFTGGLLWGDSLIFASPQTNLLVRVSTRTCTATVYELDLPGQGVNSLAYDEESGDCWLLDKENALICWSLKAGITQRVEHVIDGDDVCGLIYHSGALWAFPVGGNDYYVRYDITTGRTTRREHYLPEDLRGGIWSLALKKDERYIYILPNTSEVLTKLEVATETVQVHTIRLAEQDKHVYMEAQFHTNDLVEGEFINKNELATWLECCETRKVDKESLGAIIYREMI